MTHRNGVVEPEPKRRTKGTEGADGGERHG